MAESWPKELIFKRDKLKKIACRLRTVVQYTQTDCNGMRLNPFFFWFSFGKEYLITYSILLVHWYDWYQRSNIYSIQKFPLSKDSMPAQSIIMRDAIKIKGGAQIYFKSIVYFKSKTYNGDP